MVKEAQEYEEQDKREADRISAKNELENICYSIKNAEDSDGDMKSLAEENLTWLNGNQLASEEEYRSRVGQLQEKMTQGYQQGGGMPDVQPSGGSASEEPKIEEVD